MDNRTTCATFTSDILKNAFSSMCPHCSTIQFDADKNTYWKCNKYNVKLEDNEDKCLTRCAQCMKDGDL